MDNEEEGFDELPEIPDTPDAPDPFDVAAPDPYDVPEDPELRIDTQSLSPELAAHKILVRLEAEGFIQ